MLEGIELQAPPENACPGGHPMVVTTAMAGVGYICDSCGCRSADGHLEGSRLRWRCGQCDFDECFSCRPCTHPPPPGLGSDGAEQKSPSGRPRSCTTSLYLSSWADHKRVECMSWLTGRWCAAVPRVEAMFVLESQDPKYYTIRVCDEAGGGTLAAQHSTHFETLEHQLPGAMLCNSSVLP